jgi:hydroxymethylglutaryl-CoA reductase (NADPH)
VPLATTEGTLVASYNRGMRVITAAGGAKVTVVDDAMQRAPVFIFEDARQARQMGEWIEDNFAEIKSQAETTTQVGQLRNIEQYAAARMRYLRFNFTTGDAAGQNMVSKGLLMFESISCFLKAFCSTAFCFHFRHNNSLRIG